MPTRETISVRSASPIRDPDRYEILGEHGRGGLGRVSRAHDKDLGRDIAIKELLSRGHINDLRFVREAMITARLEHPGIVPVHEAGRWPDGTPFYAMKLVSGRPLRALIAERKTIDERIGLLHHVIAVADAIAYAHGRNIIHRDLKPANVIVGDFGETVVIDWGLAKDLSAQVELEGGDGPGAAAASLDDQLTSLGSVLGTPAYMAPEQERGEAVDQRADVFAIGAMLWELCSLHKVPPTNVRQRHRMLRRAGIDQDLVAIIDKTIDPDPRGRYRDAAALATDLKAFKSGARITARDYSLVATLAHWTRRHRALAFSAMAFVVLLIASVASLAMLYRSSSRNAVAARSNAVAAHRSAETAQQLLTQSYVDQGRRALLDGKYSEALAYLVHAAHRGDDSPGVRFMLERAAQPIAAEVLRLPSTEGRFWSAAFSRDGRRILTGDDKGGRLWDATTGRPLVSLPHGGLVYQAQFSPDDDTAVTFGNGFVRQWDARTGALLRTMIQPPGVTRSYRAGAISLDGKRIAAIDADDASTYVWDAQTGTALVRLRNEDARGVALAFSHDGRWLATTGGNEVRVFDTETWRPRLVLPAKSVRSLSFDPTGPRLATGTALGSLSIWAIPSGTRIQSLMDVGDAIGRVVFSPDGAFIAAATNGEVAAAFVWRTSSGELQMRLNPRHGLWALEFDRSSTLVLGAGADGQVTVSDVISRTVVATLEGPGGVIFDAHFDASARRVIAASLDGTARVWDLGASYRRWTSQAIGKDCGTAVMPAKDTRFVAVGCTEHRTRVWHTASDRLLVELPSVTLVDPLRQQGAVVSAEGDVAAIAQGSTVELFTIPEGRLLRSVQHTAPVTSVRFARSGRTLVTGSANGSLLLTPDGEETVALPSTAGAIDAVEILGDGRVLAADDHKQLHLYDRHRAVAMAFALPTRAAAFRTSHDGHRLIVIAEITSPTNPVLCDLEHGRIIAELKGHHGQVYAAQFVRDDRQILTAGTDGTARLWDGLTGDLQQTYLADSTQLVDAALSPDGSTIAAAGGDGRLTFWNAVTGQHMWTLRAHRSFISSVRFEGTGLITRGIWGELSRWEIPRPTSSRGWLDRFDRLVGCASLRFDDATAGLVTQQPPCNSAADPAR